MIDSVEALAAMTGREAGVSDWVEVTQAMIDRFADLTGDRQWIHVDPVRAAAESPFGSTVAHGFLTLALVSGMVRQAVRLDWGAGLTVNYGFNRLRFPAPVPSGSRIRARVAVGWVKPVPGGVEVAWEVTVEVGGHAKPALVAHWLTRMYGMDQYAGGKEGTSSTN